jgi:hypothetical protein
LLERFEVQLVVEVECRGEDALQGFDLVLK